MFIQQAFRGKNEIWRYIIGLVVIVLGWQVFGVLPLFIVAFITSGDINSFLSAAENSFMSLGIDTNFLLALMIFSFVVGLGALYLSVTAIHHKKIIDVTTTRSTVDWSRIKFSFLLVLIVNVLFFGISYVLEPEIFILNFEVVPFLILLIIALVLLPLQTSFEEYLFRGYLMQWFGLLAKNRWVPLLVTSIIFGLLHGANPEVAKLGNVMMIFYIGTGLLLGVLTLMDEGMELALGFHAANNIVAAVLVTTNWSVFQTNAIFLDISEPSGGIDIVLPVLIVYPIYLLIFAKKYGWTNWKERLTGKVVPPKQNKSIEI
ncbi:type II CAAX prenyl endopeptidase Rce1 family protein [Aquimarina sp. W85]|uniref:CPBP family glutamic-type intramembrane protease n=1 Tax=Aquimarina rhodophyticola TaxID=3342246 RepID=UPI00366F5EC0